MADATAGQRRWYRVVPIQTRAVGKVGAQDADTAQLDGGRLDFDQRPGFAAAPWMVLCPAQGVVWGSAHITWPGFHGDRIWVVGDTDIDFERALGGRLVVVAGR